MAHDFFPGEQLGRYRLERVLGGGGFATVWRARAEGPGGFERSVAIKVIRPGRASQKRFRDMLLDEARLVARIQHPNVAQVWEVGEDPRSLYVVMELVDGASLDDLRELAEEAGERLSPRVVFRVLSDVCAGLHAAHELETEPGSGELLGLVHRDVSPHNILVGRHGTAKLIDFGIAKAKERLSGETTTGIIKGKLSFMAPEQARAEPTVDRRVDVWAVGAVAYELLEGRPPFDAATDLGRLAALAGPHEAEPLGDATPAPLRRVVARALRKDPNERFPTALAMKEAIDEALIESELETSAEEVASELAPWFGPAPERIVKSSTAPSGVTAARTELAAVEPSKVDATLERGLSSTILAHRGSDELTLPRSRTSPWLMALFVAVVGLPVGAWWWSRGDATPRDASTEPVAREGAAAQRGGAPSAAPGPSAATTAGADAAQLDASASAASAVAPPSANAVATSSVAPIVLEDPARSATTAAPTGRPAPVVRPRPPKPPAATTLSSKPAASPSTSTPPSPPPPRYPDDDAIE